MRIRVHNISSTKGLRRRLRRKATDTEQLLWRELRNRKLNNEKFTRQHGIGAYVTDFYCSKYRLAIEVDGEIHQTPDNIERDQIRSEFIEAWEVTILRFSNEEVFENIDQVLETIRRFLH